MSVIYFVDTETGGLDPSKHSIFSIAIVQWEGFSFSKNEISVIYESPLIKESTALSYTDKALEINKISIEDVEKKGVNPKKVAERIIKCLNILGCKEHILGGHNVSFDIGFIKRLFYLGGLPYPFSYRTVDTCSIARFLAHSGIINPKQFGLEDLCDYFEIDINMLGLHTALGDALATALLYNKMIDSVHSR